MKQSSLTHCAPSHSPLADLRPCRPLPPQAFEEEVDDSLRRESSWDDSWSKPGEIKLNQSSLGWYDDEDRPPRASSKKSAAGLMCHKHTQVYGTGFDWDDAYEDFCVHDGVAEARTVISVEVTPAGDAAEAAGDGDESDSESESDEGDDDDDEFDDGYY